MNTNVFTIDFETVAPELLKSETLVIYGKLVLLELVMVRQEYGMSNLMKTLFITIYRMV